MIDKEIRHIIEPELKIDEDLLWAERVDERQIEAFVRNKMLSDKLWLPVMIFLALAFAFTGFSAFPIEAESRVELLATLLGIVIIFGMTLLFLFSAKQMAKAFISNVDYEHYYDLQGYALSNSRAFFLNAKEPKIKSISLLKPKVSKFSNRWSRKYRSISNSILIDHSENYAGTNPVEFKFLRDIEKSTTYLDALLEGNTP